MSLIVTFWWGQALPACDQMERELTVLARALETAGFAKEGPWGNCISKNLTEMKGQVPHQEEWERVEKSAGGRRGRRGRCREEWTQERNSNVGPWTVWGAEEA